MSCPVESAVDPGVVEPVKSVVESVVVEPVESAVEPVQPDVLIMESMPVVESTVVSIQVGDSETQG
jgi:hypothetical protein